MSNHVLYLKVGYPSANVSNGIGRYVPQLKRITFKYCKSLGTSRGVRDFIETDLIKFAEAYPSAAIYLKPRRHRQPVLKAEYLDGTMKWMNLAQLERGTIIRWLHLIMNQSSGEPIRLRKKIHTENPSIQGVWTPHIYSDPRFNLVKIPDDRLSRPVHVPKTATERLIELFKKQEAKAQNEKQIEEGAELKTQSPSC